MSTLTKEHLVYEWRVIYDTRLGILCGNGFPTPEQNQIARDEANAHIAKLKAQEKEI